MAVIALLSFLLAQRQRRSVPAEGSQAYEQVTRVFYRGLAALEVGLLDNARQDFTQTTQLAADEPAGWADLGVTHLRLGELDAAAEPIMRALSLAPRNGQLELLAARMETARGRIDEGIAHLRRAVELDPNGLRPRYALAQQLEQSGSTDGEAEALRVLDELVTRAPNNLVVLLDRARIAAKRSDADRLLDSAARIDTLADGWPAIAREQLGSLQRAAASGDFTEAARRTVLLRNVLTRVTMFRESLAAVATPAELVAEPLIRFVAMSPPVATPAPPDLSTTFTADVIPNMPLAGSLIAVPMNATDAAPALLGVDRYVVRRLDGPGGEWTFPGKPGGDRRGATSVLSIDWNHDFRTDLFLAGPDGVRLLLQREEGGFEDATVRAGARFAFTCDCNGAWAADVDMDGDLDVVVGVKDAPTTVLRNNGDRTWEPQTTFAPVRNAVDFAWADLDGDGDPDAAVLDASATLRVFLNRQSGVFAEVDPISGVNGFTVGDPDGDGLLDIVTLQEEVPSCRGSCGVIRRRGPGRVPSDMAVIRRDGVVDRSAPAVGNLLFLRDIDNNGAPDLIVNWWTETRVLLGGDNRTFHELPIKISARISSIADVNGDGRLDLIGVDGGQPVRLLGSGQKRYHWTTFRARAQERAGDQRINSFGVGGDIEVRSGLLAQKQLLTGMPLHFGLGTQTTVDVARIVWPNGVPQAEFNVRVDEAIVAEQRLKGSCPWVFAFDGQRVAFVTDFLWRSPLGLRINAQDTAGIGQTEDWVRIRGDQLAPRDGVYDIRITAELWETHFFDLASLLVVDHPADAEVFVDERFAAGRPQKLAVQTIRNVRPVLHASDDRGRDVTDLIAHRDGRYLSGFALGAYQGIAEDHFVELDLGETPTSVRPKPDAANEAPEAARRTVLVASGWVYPTDSSINLAIAQNSVRPRGISLEAQDARGQWRVVERDLGFPAGKNKTMLIDLDGIGDARRLRLRTNLEVYWDSLTLGTASTASVSTMRIGASSAELRYRGFSQTRSPRGESPETPDYTQLENTSPRWRDLTGYYTRFGDVRELVERVDDRYVIMNAGDELRLQFSAPTAPRPGWRRDFVLIGDGWEKDGDYNTGYSSTVLPLPTHGSTTYEASSVSMELEDDAVYRAHADDWARYHTRYVSPEAFVRGLFVH